MTALQPTSPNLPNLPVTSLTSDTSTSFSAAPATPPSSSFIDTVAEDTADDVAAQQVLDLHAELIQGYHSDPWFADTSNLQDLLLLEGLWLKGDRIVVPNVQTLHNALM